MLKVLQVHNRYFSGLGGEDTVLAEEYSLLRQHGHPVEQLIVLMRDADIRSAWKMARTGMQTIWSLDGYRLMSDALKRHRPDIVHVHNTFPLLSPSVYWAAHHRGIPVVQTLHNYRLTCANGMLLRDGVPCEACVGSFPLAGIRHRCFKHSLGLTSAVVGMQVVNHAISSYAKVDAYIAVTDFAKSVMVRAGLPEAKIHVKPNFIAETIDLAETIDEAARPAVRKPQVLFVGRIAKEKGPDLLLEAWTALNTDRHTLVFVGDGPDRSELQGRVAGNPSIEWRGTLDRRDVLREMRQSQYLVVCSRWYEGLPMVILEAFSTGTPVIVPRLGALPDLIGGSRFGIAFEAGKTAALRDTLEVALNVEQPEWREQSVAARDAYTRIYTPEANYRQLIEIYETALEQSHSGPCPHVVR